jgi:2'-5' RNA ligase
VKPERVRLFFALWPNDAVRQALWRSSAPLREACRGQPVAKRNLHLTLLFLGGVDERRLPDIEAAAAGIRVPGFSLVFDGWGRFDKASVAWLGCRHPDPRAAALAGGLAGAMEKLGFPPERRPFRPHLTVIRKCRDGSPAEPIDPVTWPVDEFTLVRSLTLPSGPVYEVIARWPLAG